MDINVNINMTPEFLALLGKDFNPFNLSAKERFLTSLDLFVESFKSAAHVIAQADQEGLTLEEMAACIDSDDYAFAQMLVPEQQVLDQDDVEGFKKLAEVIGGENFNPYNWSARIRIPMVFGNFVSCIKSLIHIMIQADQEGTNLEELITEIDPETIKILSMVA